LRRVAAIENSARQTLADMRRLVTIDADDTTEAGQAKLGPQPGMADVPALVQQLLEAGADVSLERSEPTGRLSPGADLALFRITQEALTNALNHAPGAQIRVRVIACDQGVELEVVNGPARRPGTGPGSGRGLIGMRQRADMYQGTLLCGPDPSGGFSIRAQLTTDATRA
jgi:signal transduction histidine kinase